MSLRHVHHSSYHYLARIPLLWSVKGLPSPLDLGRPKGENAPACRIRGL